MFMQLSSPKAMGSCTLFTHSGFMTPSCSLETECDCIALPRVKQATTHFVVQKFKRGLPSLPPFRT